MYKHFFKRFLDLLICLGGLIAFAPFFIVIFLVLLYNNKGTPFFYQKRPGLHGKIFKVIKFKTMNDRKDKDGVLLSDSDRLTSVGKFVRKTSLDEIPQLINVLKGDMSLIGPRPLLPEYLPLYNLNQKKRHNIRPGITGLAQINGRNCISWEKKFEYDVKYVNNVSFLLDFKIFFLTVKKVFKSEGINQENSATTNAFNGEN